MKQDIYYIIDNTDGKIKYLNSISGSRSSGTYYESPNLAIEFDELDTARAIANWLSRNNPDMDIKVAKMTCTIDIL